MAKGPTPTTARRNAQRAPKTFLRFGSDMFARMKVRFGAATLARSVASASRWRDRARGRRAPGGRAPPRRAAPAAACKHVLLRTKCTHVCS
jgi:hypothetical protein